MELSYKDLKLNVEEKTCLINDEEVSLTKTEFIILQTLLENKNKVFSREDFIKDILKNNASIRTIDVNIKRLRDKLGDYKENIITKRGFGYTFKEI